MERDFCDSCIVLHVSCSETSTQIETFQVPPTISGRRTSSRKWHSCRRQQLSWSDMIVNESHYFIACYYDAPDKNKILIRKSVWLIYVLMFS
jgi:hypothetical protein